MELRLEDGLLMASCAITYKGNRTVFSDVLLDTGCAASVFDIDLMESMGFKPDCKTARIVKMYGVGGSEACIEQRIYSLGIDDHQFAALTLHLSDIRTRYGFDAILGNDIMSTCGLMLDLLHLVIRQHQPTCLPLFH
ncbi:aspartyl protease family protein [Tuberibacillus calidus]|jgi:hypothetical protein|uniref:aspartyl protease family protein n=1 Tax=Tuberibacillus calidus TaxID=340097 RepID=UPI00041A9A05|nr:aspartyl protease family protein [Tuberibacillus calidus]